MKTQGGFTLIELAVVVAIVSILAAVAMPRFSTVNVATQRKNASDISIQLQSAASMYKVRQAAPPTRWSDFVGTGVRPTGRQTTVLRRMLGVTNAAQCTMSAASITCNKNVFPDMGAVTYTWSSNEVIRCTSEKFAC